MKWRYLGSAVLVFTSVSQGENLKTTDQILTQANHHLTSGKFNEAYHLFSEAIVRDPHNHITYFKRATASMTLGRNQLAIEDLNTLLELKPDFLKGFLQRGKLHLKLGNFDQAYSDITRFVSKNPQHPEATQLLEVIKESQARLRKAETLIKSRKHEEASDLLTEILRSSPHFIEARRKRAYSAISRNLYDEAIGDWTRIVALSPSDHDCLANLAHVYYYALYEPETALKNVKQFLHSDPEHKRFKALFRQLKDSEKKLTKLDQLAKNKAWKDVVALLDGTNEKYGLLKEAETKVSDMMALVGSTQPGPNKLMGKLYHVGCLAYSRLRDSRAIDMCTRALELDPENVKTLVARSEMFLRQELFEKAVEDLIKAHELSEKDPKVGEKLQKARLLLKQSRQRDYYKVLGVARTASQKQIKTAYRKLATQWHPDKYKGDLPKETIQQKMAEINQAYEVLSNEELRQRYDQGDDPNDPGGAYEAHGHPFEGDFGPFFQFHQGGFSGSHFTFSF